MYIIIIIPTVNSNATIPLISYLAKYHIENINNGNMTVSLKVVQKIIIHNVMVFSKFYKMHIAYTYHPQYTF